MAMYELDKLAERCGCPLDDIMDTARCVGACMAALKEPFSCIKTLDFAEATAMLSFFPQGRTESVRFLELGTQYGLSTRLVHDVLKMKGITPIIRTYDIQPQEHLFDAAVVDFRCEDITERCAEVLDDFRPDAVFLDAHPWHLTYNATVEARKRDLLLFMHDVSDALWETRVMSGQLPLEGNECDPKVPWERKVLEELFGPEIHTHSHATDDYHIDIVNSGHGLAICRPRSRSHDG